MRVVRTSDELTAAWETARNEAQQAFGVPDVYLEKFIEHPRHIEFQVLGDHHGHVLHLGERECSIQRRHQKLVEESPSPAMDPEARARSWAAQVVDALKNDRLHQRRHRRVPDGRGRLVLFHRDERAHSGGASGHRDGHQRGPDQGADPHRRRRKTRQTPPARWIFTATASNAASTPRIPETFVPSAGRITTFQMPGGTGVRVDTAAHADAVISPYYDSLVAKLIVRGRDRAEAIARMRRALEMFVIEGIKTSLPLHQRIFADPDFAAGKFDTHFLEHRSSPCLRSSRAAHERCVSHPSMQ